jgi:hypothetical protein
MDDDSISSYCPVRMQYRHASNAAPPSRIATGNATYKTLIVSSYRSFLRFLFVADLGESKVLADQAMSRTVIPEIGIKTAASRG